MKRGDSVPTARGTDGTLPIVELKGVEFHAITEEQCVHFIHNELEAGRGGWVVTPNLDILRLCNRPGPARELVAKAEIVVADGMPLIWASRLQGTPLPERVSGSNLISSISKEAAHRGHSIFLLGGMPGTAEAAADVLIRRDPDLRIVGSYCPEFGFEKDETAIEDIGAALRAAEPDLVFVALSFPKGEFLTERLRADFPRLWWVGVGISFSFLAGDVKRAPAWMQRIGVEWIHRLSQEPRRLAGRYLTKGLPFAVSLLAGSALRRLGRRSV